MLAPTRDFARPIIGTVGEATKEDVDASGGTVVAGDQVGLSGLQERYDAQMRGTPVFRCDWPLPSRVAAQPVRLRLLHRPLNRNLSCYSR